MQKTAGKAGLRGENEKLSFEHYDILPYRVICDNRCANLTYNGNWEVRRSNF